MTERVLELIDLGPGVSLQDLGRRGWKSFGVPPGGALDDHAARWANLLLGNPLNSPVLELLFHGATFRALRRMEVAATGAAAPVGSSALHWRTWVVEEGEQFTVAPSASGVWTYLGIRGGWVGPKWFGSVAIFPRGGFGEALTSGTILARCEHPGHTWPASVGQRWLDPAEQRDYAHPPHLRVWPGPQWDLLTEKVRTAFFEQTWRISARCDRTGYRLEGAALRVPAMSLTSEPVLPGSIQIPPSGDPIVTMRDGPTVGGYPKLGLVDPDHLSWLAQCRPGQEIRFSPVETAANRGGNGGKAARKS